MLLSTGAYSQMVILLILFLSMDIKLAHCLSHLFSELLVGVFENTKCLTILFGIQKAFLLLYSVHVHVDFLILHFSNSFSIQLFLLVKTLELVQILAT